MKGDQGVRGSAGIRGETGLPGPKGAKGNPGPVGIVGAPGEIGKPGPIGNTGPRGADGPVGTDGPAGPKGFDGSLKKYELTGDNRFVLQDSNVPAKIYSGAIGGAPVLYLETDTNPASISMYQADQKDDVASINGWHGNIGIGEKKPTAKLQVKGQIMMSDNYNNVLVSSEERWVGGQKETVDFDLIGTYFGLDNKAIYIGGYVGREKTAPAGKQATKVVFGGSTNEQLGKAYVDLPTGQIYASGFITPRQSTGTKEEADEAHEAYGREVESLIQVDTGAESRDVDLGQSSRYLHRKVREQAATISNLERLLEEIKGHLNDIKQLVHH